MSYLQIKDLRMQLDNIEKIKRFDCDGASFKKFGLCIFESDPTLSDRFIYFDSPEERDNVFFILWTVSGAQNVGDRL